MQEHISEQRAKSLQMQAIIAPPPAAAAAPVPPPAAAAASPHPDADVAPVAPEVGPPPGPVPHPPEPLAEPAPPAAPAPEPEPPADDKGKKKDKKKDKKKKGGESNGEKDVTADVEDGGGGGGKKKSAGLKAPSDPNNKYMQDPDETIGDYIREFLTTKTWSTLVATATFFALFQVDVCTMYFGKREDKPLAYITLAVFIVFFVEMSLNFILKIDYGALPGKEKFTFYMILDAIGTLSLIPDFVIIFGIEFDSLPNGTLARVARTARIGARLTRLMKLFRSSGGDSIYSQMAMGDGGEEVVEESAASGFGEAVSDGISKRVVSLTLLLLVTVPLFMAMPEVSKQEALDYIESLPRDKLANYFGVNEGAIRYYQEFEEAQMVYFAFKDDNCEVYESKATGIVGPSDGTELFMGKTCSAFQVPREPTDAPPNNAPDGTPFTATSPKGPKFRRLATCLPKADGPLPANDCASAFGTTGGSDRQESVADGGTGDAMNACPADCDFTPAKRRMEGGCATYRPTKGMLHGILSHRKNLHNEDDSNYDMCNEDDANWHCPVACLGRAEDVAAGELAVVDWMDDRKMRRGELSEYETDTLKVVFYFRNLKIHEAWVTIMYMLFNIVVFGSATGMFLNQVFDLVVNPMERMCSALQMMSKQFAMLAPDDDHEGDELAGLGDGIMKLTDLLQVSLGDAGTKIITGQLKGSDEVDALQPGEKMNGYFGFCFVNDFGFLLEALEEDIMIFTNIISDMVHRQVSTHLGSPNKNIGDSWLCVWNASEEQVFTARQLEGEKEMTYADHAVVAFAGVITEVKANRKLEALCDRDSFKAKYPQGYQVSMGFGLHYGWAIEGAVGSKRKMDATYLSPHVNMSARLEAATNQMKVDMLVSETFYKHMTPEFQRWVYKVDRVVVVGASAPMILYAYDDGPDEQNDYLDKKNRFAHEFDAGVELYIHGNWTEAKKLLFSCLGARPNNPAATNLLEHMERDSVHGESPDEWPGYRILTSK